MRQVVKLISNRALCTRFEDQGVGLDPPLGDSQGFVEIAASLAQMTIEERLSQRLGVREYGRGVVGDEVAVLKNTSLFMQVLGCAVE